MQPFWQPFSFWDPTAFCFGWVLFGEFPVDKLFPGVILIIGSGLVILWREHRAKVDVYALNCAAFDQEILRGTHGGITRQEQNHPRDINRFNHFF